MNSRRIRASLALSALACATLVTGSAHADGPLLPQTGCLTVTDGSNDAKSPPVTGDVSTISNDSKLDITGVAVGTKGRTLLIYIKVPALDGTTRDGFGPRFDVDFEVEGVTGKAVKLAHAMPNDNYKKVNTSASFPMMFVTSTKQTVDQTKFSATFDLTNKFVIFNVDLDDLATRTGATANGVKLNKFKVMSRLLVHSVQAGSPNPVFAYPTDQDMDYVPNAATPAVYIPYTLGDNTCFEPPASKLASLTGNTVQYGDVANLSAKLTKEAGGTALAGKQVKFSIAGKSATATTGADGVAKVALAHGKLAGSYPLTVEFAGDDGAGAVKLTDTLVVKLETVKLTLSVKRSGLARIITATLVDDDKHAVASQSVSWYVGSAKKVTKTNSSGKTTYTAKAGQTVTVKYLGYPGKYAPASAKVKV